MLLLINANWYQTEEKHLLHLSAGQYTTRVVHWLCGNMVDEFAVPCPDLEDYYAWERNILFLLSLIMNRFAGSTRGSPLKGILAERYLDRWCEQCYTHYWRRQALRRLRLMSKFLIRWRGLISIIYFNHLNYIKLCLLLTVMVRHSWRCS